MNQFYNIWNYDYIQQQAQAEHHFRRSSRCRIRQKHCMIFWMVLIKSNRHTKMLPMRSFVRFFLHILASTTEDNIS